MNQEMLWKLELLCMRSRWKLLCIEFDDAKQNYISMLAPLLKNIGENITEAANDDIFLQIEKAEVAWKNWIDIQIKLKTFIEGETQMDTLKSTYLI